MSSGLPTSPSKVPRGATPQHTPGFPRGQQSSASPLRAADTSNKASAQSPRTNAPMTGQKSRGMQRGGDALSRLPPAQLRDMRESFQMLDRDNSGVVTRENVAEMLNELGQDASKLSRFPAQTNLASYLSGLADSLSPLSPPDELVAAFSAFDPDDSGQVDVEELRRALLGTAPEPGAPKLDAQDLDAILHDFGGRRAFKRGVASSTARGQVFRYHDFVKSVGGGGGGEGAGAGDGEEQAVEA